MKSKHVQQLETAIGICLNNGFSHTFNHKYDNITIKSLEDSTISNLSRKIGLTNLLNLNPVQIGKITHFEPSAIGGFSKVIEVAYSNPPVQTGKLKIKFHEYGAEVSSNLGNDKLNFSVPYKLTKGLDYWESENTSYKQMGKNGVLL